jgi:hypothetical protein
MVVVVLPEVVMSDNEYRHAAILDAFASLLASNGIHEAIQLGVI